MKSVNTELTREKREKSSTYRLYNIYNLLNRIGYSDKEIDNALNKMDSEMKQNFNPFCEISNLRKSPDGTRTSEKNYVLFLKALKEILIILEKNRKNVVTTEDIQNIIDKNTGKNVIYDVYKIMMAKGYTNLEIKEALKQINSQIKITLEKISGGNIESPKEVMYEEIDHTICKKALNKLEYLLIKNRSFKEKTLNSVRYAEKIKRNAYMVMLDYKDKLGFLTPREIMIIILYTGLDLDIKYSVDEISDIIGVSSHYVLRTVNENKDKFLKRIKSRKK